MVLKHWREKDIGKVICYREITEENKIVLIEKIVDVGSEKDYGYVLRVMDYPITENSRHYCISCCDRDKKKLKNQLKETGDWYFVDVYTQLTLQFF